MSIVQFLVQSLCGVSVCVAIGVIGLWILFREEDREEEIRPK